MPNLKSAESGAHEGAPERVTIFQLTSNVATKWYATFATKNLSCCSVGTKDRNWLQIFI